MSMRQYYENHIKLTASDNLVMASGDNQPSIYSGCRMMRGSSDQKITSDKSVVRLFLGPMKEVV